MPTNSRYQECLKGNQGKVSAEEQKTKHGRGQLN